MTKVFKFGGASVKNADGVIQVVKILNQYHHNKINKLFIINWLKLDMYIY